MGGWGIIAADIVVMASLAQIAGRYFLELVGAGAAGHRLGDFWWESRLSPCSPGSV